MWSPFMCLRSGSVGRHSAARAVLRGDFIGARGDTAAHVHSLCARYAEHTGLARQLRELRNTVDRLLILFVRFGDDGSRLDRLAGQLRSRRCRTRFSTQCRPSRNSRMRAERAFLLNKLREFRWNVSETARAVEMPRSNLYKKIERYSLSREAHVAPAGQPNNQ